ncbi:MAG: UDP-N-acetylmuramate dehydrogenase [Candidatus Magasanikbacteria bacterium]
MDALYEQLKNYGHVRANVSLARFSTFKIGGPAKFLIEIKEADNLVAVLNWLSGEGVEFFVLGGGSNILFPDEGLDKVAIKIQSTKYQIQDIKIIADAGVSLAQIVNEATQAGLTGIEWGAGIPGTIGGAVRGNAGAYGEDVAQNLEKVEVWQSGQVTELKAEECEFGYRESLFKHSAAVVLRAHFKLIPGDKNEILKKVQGYILDRSAKFPRFPSAGSFFKNLSLADFAGDKSKLPEKFLQVGKVGAAWLIDQCGLKGYTVGGAKISDEHANFIVNFNGATQSDVLTLVEKVIKEVYNKYGVELDSEVEIVKL